MVGSALMRRLAGEDCELVTADRRSVDFTRQAETETFMQDRRPDVVVIAAAKVGGIVANDSLPVDFLADNLAIGLNLVASAHKTGVRKLLFLGSSCIYPQRAPQPMREDALLTGPLEPTNEWYAVAKIAGIRLCQAYRRQYGDDFISAMPTNLYGPGDNYHPEHSHVPAGLIRRMHEAKLAGAPSVTIWGTGKPRREFMFVDDLADACVFLMNEYDELGHINVGTGEDLSIRELAETLRDIIYPEATLRFDTSKPDGSPRKLLDVSRLHALGWRHRISFSEGLTTTYQWFLDHRDSLRTSASSTAVTR
jgi:GDP-L-fucose synthase